MAKRGELYNQPTLRPVRKVQYAAAGAGLGTVLGTQVAMLAVAACDYFGLYLSGAQEQMLSVFITGVIGYILSMASGWIFKERKV